MLIACEIYCGKNKRTGLLFLSWIRYNRPRDPLPSRGRLSTHGKGVIIHHGSIAVIKKQKHLCTGAKASVGKHCIAGIQYLLWRNVDIDVEGPPHVPNVHHLLHPTVPASLPAGFKFKLCNSVVYLSQFLFCENYIFAIHPRHKR